MNLNQLKNGGTLNNPIYKVKQYVVSEAPNSMILHAGDLQSLLNLSSYFDHCVVDIRKYDLYMNDNTKV